MTTSRFNLANVNVGVAGWDAIIDSNTETIDEVIPSRIINTMGESVAAYKAVQVKSDGLIWQAQADGTNQPARGIMFEAGVTSDVKRIQTLGPITTTGWAWTPGLDVYLDQTNAGEITHALPATTANQQKIGWAISAISIFVNPS